MYTLDDFGPDSPRPGRRIRRAVLVIGGLAALIVFLFFRGAVVTRFQVWRLSSGSEEARASAWRKLVDRGRARDALSRIEYAEFAPFSSATRFGSGDRDDYISPPRFSYVYARFVDGSPPEDHVYIKLLDAETSFMRYLAVPPKVLVWGRPDDDSEAMRDPACRLVSRLAFGTEKLDIQLAQPVRYAVDLNAANRVIRIRLRREAAAGPPGYYVRLTPRETRPEPEVLDFISRLGLEFTDPAGREPGDLASWIGRGNEASYFLLNRYPNANAATDRMSKLAVELDHANAEWRRTKGGAAIPLYGLDVVDSKRDIVSKRSIIRRRRLDGSAGGGGTRTVTVNTGGAPPPGATVYVVQPGDVLSKIARHHGTTVEKIVSASGLRDADQITVGQKLYIPKKAD